MSGINTNKRLFDLVRYSRANLHEEGLITDKEYAWLCGEAEFARSPEGGSPSPRRLEDYDATTKLLAEAQETIATLNSQLDAIAKLSKNLSDSPLSLREHLVRWADERLKQ